jgi:hypothetical protein
MVWRVVGITAGVAAALTLTSITGAQAAGAAPGAPLSPPAARASQAAPSSVPAYAPAGAAEEAGVLDAARLLGIPVARTAQFPAASPVAFFSAACMADRQFARRLRTYVAGGRRALVTSRLALRLGRLPSDFAARVFILPSQGGARTVLALPQAQVDRLRNFTLFPLGLRMEAPPRVSLRLVGREALVIENQNAFAAGVKLTFLKPNWPGISALANDDGPVPLSGSTVSLQAPPKKSQRFRIVSRE